MDGGQLFSRLERAAALGHSGVRQLGQTTKLSTLNGILMSALVRRTPALEFLSAFVSSASLREPLAFPLPTIRSFYSRTRAHGTHTPAFNTCYCTQMRTIHQYRLMAGKKPYLQILSARCDRFSGFVPAPFKNVPLFHPLFISVQFVMYFSFKQQYQHIYHILHFHFYGVQEKIVLSIRILLKIIYTPKIIQARFRV